MANVLEPRRLRNLMPSRHRNNNVAPCQGRSRGKMFRTPLRFLAPKISFAPTTFLNYFATVRVRLLFDNRYEQLAIHSI
jgi:hypothetical protein